MRTLVILAAIGFGMALSWLMLLNPQPVTVVLDAGRSGGWIDPPVRTMPLWHVIFWSVFAGIGLGLLAAWGFGADRRRRMRELDERPGADGEDYLIGLSQRPRR